MTSRATTLGSFIAELMERQQHSNRSLATAAGVSEGVIRNLLKHGTDSRAKDPDPRTLRKVADALEVDAIMLFRLAGYIPPQSNANSVRAEYLADVFDELPPEKQDAVLGVLEAMTSTPTRKATIQQMRKEPANPIAGIDRVAPDLVRLIANHLIAHYQMTEPAQASAIEPEAQFQQYTWKDLPPAMRQRIKALIEHKLSLKYDPTMVDPEWRE